LWVLALLSAASAAHAADPPRYLTVLNRAHDSILGLQVAAAGSDAFEVRTIDRIEAGGGSATVRLGNTGCRFDLRLEFRNGRDAIYREVDACRGDVLVVQPLPS
jgi:hypothetical protein